jgi:hypothetical protein
MQSIYLDSCCYFRPYDDLLQDKIRTEAAAKLFVQSLISYGAYSLAYSYMSVIEINDGYFEDSKIQIMRYIKENADIYVSDEKRREIEKTATEIMQTGIKHKDAVHLSCALLSGSDFFLTTDKRVLKWQSNEIKVLNPIDFVMQRGE